MAVPNAGKVKFDPPSVPVIFVLGGPGSGKVTHCDTLMHEKRGVTHINMMDLLHQHVISNDMQDFSNLSSKIMTEVLMLEIKMAPAAKAYLISGFPRSMRDVVEYSDKIQVISGVILVKWKNELLQKQIEYGAKLGQVVLSLAKMELDNFYKNVMPVCEYFDQSGLLSVVVGERPPDEVYRDFRSAVFEILGSQDNPNALMNGVVGMGKGINDIPGTIVSVETAPEGNVEAEAEASETIEPGNVKPPTPHVQTPIEQTPRIEVTHILDEPTTTLNNNNNIDVANLPPIIWVIGGPGSNKSTLCLKAVALNPGWSHFSIGRIVRAIAESDPKANTENHKIKNAITAGEMINKQSIQKILETHLVNLSDKKGIIIDGYPRDMKQVTDFQEKYHQKPPIILLDCSKLQLGRGRLDDTVSSFRRRLEQFRELTLPMLKVLDADGRLSIVDGDTDNTSVQREFERVIRQHTSRLSHEAAYKPQSQTNQLMVQQQQNNDNIDSIVEDLDNMPGSVPTISNHISLIHNNNKGTIENDQFNNNANHVANNINAEKKSRNPTKTFRSMLEEAETYPLDEA
ncbi:adenylate kinase isoenzyme 5 isoform X2 [Contarinia nasturtii]|nr:adenylate kinase isoenzyme 5 isoform X2 [Contarinia nasturtii]XP_031619360.1 adenylate kinase isoenzyme 5 isoform X2 [Contarinia nasturtii]XP_031619361.1 adenylate kinase isoenzyme 5 isoform X2 [Contarinia nasturtii]